MLLRAFRRGFTLIELLIVIAIIAVLIALLLPSIGKARQTGKVVRCMSNLRQLEIAQNLYADSYKEWLVDAGLAHGGSASADEMKRAWPFVLSEFVGTSVGLHSPLDRSDAWPVSEGGTSTMLSLAQFTDLVAAGQAPSSSNLARWTSYGLNNWLSRSVNPGLFPTREPFDRLSKIQNPAATVQFLTMTFDPASSYVRSDHVHAEGWGDAGLNSAPAIASQQVEIAAAFGPKKAGQSEANWGFLDGHAATLKFESVFIDFQHNKMYPPVAQ